MRRKGLKREMDKLMKENGKKIKGKECRKILSYLKEKVKGIKGKNI